MQQSDLLNVIILKRCRVQLSRFLPVLATLGPFYTWRWGPFTCSEHKPAPPRSYSSKWAFNQAWSFRTSGQQQPPQGELISAHVEVIDDAVIFSNFLIFCVVSNTRGQWGERFGNKNRWADALRTDNWQPDVFQFNQYVSYRVFSHP